MSAAVAGWNFLATKINGGTWPYNNTYQKITRYGDNFTHEDELLWAAAAMFAAGQVAGANGVDPNFDPKTQFHSWLQEVTAKYGGGTPWSSGPLSSGWGCALRDYAFAVRSGRLTGGLDAGDKAQAEYEILAAGDAWRSYSDDNSYGTSLPDGVKAAYDPGWYFSSDPAFELAVADALMVRLGAEADARYDSTKHSGNIKAMLENFNYQHGCNPLNQPFVTGAGQKRQRVIVHQYDNYPNYDARLLPSSGVPFGNISFRFQPPDDYLDAYFYPVSGGSGSGSFGLYDRWGDAHNVNREFVALQSARAVGAAAYLHSFSGASTPSWNSADGYFTVSGPLSLNTPTVVRLDTDDSTVHLNQADIVWDAEFEDQPAFGRTFTLKPRTTVGDTLVEAEAVLPDGRRVFARQYLHFRPTSGGQEFTMDTETVALYHFNDKALFPSVLPDSAHGYNLEVPINGGFPDLFTNNSWMRTPVEVANGSTPTSKAAQFGAPGDLLESSVTIPYTELPAGTDGLTIEFRLYVKRLPSSGVGLELFRLATAPAPDASAAWRIKYDASFPQIYGPRQDTPVFDSAHWSTQMTPNTWHYVKITFDATAGTTSVSVDGNPAVSRAT